MQKTNLNVTRLFFIGLLMIFSTLVLSGQTEISGLFFSSHEVVQDKRTSLNITPRAPFRLSDGFSLEFDVNFRRDDGYYGYIFRMIANGNTNIDLVSNLAADESNIWLVYKDEILLSYKWADLPSVDFDQWVRVKVDFDIKNNRLTASFNERKDEVQSPGIDQLKNIRISFGMCHIPGFYTTDVCPMSIKNVSIYKAGDKPFREWSLGKHYKDKVYDNIARAEALATNPNWLIDKYIRWRKLKEITVPGLNGITPAANSKGIYFIDEKAAYLLNFKTLDIDTIFYAGGCPYKNELRHDIIYNRYMDEIWSYDLTNPVVSRFDLKAGRWSNNQPEMSLSDYSHHNKFISPKDSSLITILGYGHYRYKGIVNIYDRQGYKWNQIDRSEDITPRYLSSTGYLTDKKVLVFGGYGSKSGRQELSPRSYYDLYEFDLTDYSFTPVWVLPTPRAPFVPSETLVADPADDSFYSLLFNNGYYDSYLQLARFGISQPKMTIVGDSIPFKFRDSETWSYLFLNEDRSDLVAVVSHKDDIALYAIAYSPLTTDDILQDIPSKKLSAWAVTGGILLTLSCIVLFFIYIRYKQSGFHIRRKTGEGLNLEPLPAVEQSQVSAIHLLGGFQVFSDKGEDVTSLFSPTLKQLFIFLLFNSSGDKKGITSAMLDEALWHDKAGNSARNNRNVNISKLRNILEVVGNMEVVNNNSFWQIKLAEAVCCDYLEVIDLLSVFKTDRVAEEKLYRLLGLLHMGDLLPDMHADWVIPYKSDFTKELIEAMSPLLNARESYPDANIRYHIAEYLLSIDSLNEEAILVKCSLLSMTGRKALAKVCFDSFAKDYKELVGIPYPLSFGEIINN